jgi:hypothetical protein
MVYALADLGAHLLLERDRTQFVNAEWSRKNGEAGRPFIEHQLEIVDFQVALERGLGLHESLAQTAGGGEQRIIDTHHHIYPPRDWFYARA